MFRLITLEQLNSLISLYIGVTHQPAVRKVPGSIPGSGKNLMGGGVILHFCPKMGYLSSNFAIHLAILIYLVYTYLAKFVTRSVHVSCTGFILYLSQISYFQIVTLIKTLLRNDVLYFDFKLSITSAINTVIRFKRI